ncbi:unnamed protein product [Adineta steineri]|uniref:G-protein coupled receptors family 1 profile domain-containing protein n=1 Tax=Adineta steineri TaxID=433720 RepID=A0A819EKG1_9BILA|nr:unnamed protein product [Adineta steineri]CAF3850738.1 unnamed protein product [Adineta steineri]
MAVTNLPFVQQNMIRYGMSMYFALGVAGNICNCIMFTRPLYRRAPSSVYHLSFSIFAILHLIWSITPQLYTLNNPDPQKQLVLYCKMRLYGTHVLALYLRYTIAWACMDRFFATRENIRLRSLSSVKVAVMLIFTTCIVCSLVAVHIPILLDIRNNICGMVGLYKLIYPFYQIPAVSILPAVLMITFSSLTIRSLHQRHTTQIQARKRDRHLLRMVIAEVVVVVATSIPDSANQIYGIATHDVVNKSAQRLEIESFITFLTQFAIYMISACPFFIFMFVSKPYRKEFVNTMIKCQIKCMQRPNRVMHSTAQ